MLCTAACGVKSILSARLLVPHPIDVGHCKGPNYNDAMNLNMNVTSPEELYVV